MSVDAQYNFPEAKLEAAPTKSGSSFAKDKLKEFKALIDANLSFVVLSMPGVGVSCFLKFLASQDFATFIHVDLYSLPALNQHEFYKLLLTELGGKPGSKTDEELLSESKKVLSKKEGKIVIVFSRFDQLKSQFTPTFLSSIQSLVTVSRNPVVEIFTSTKPIYEIAPDALTGGNLNFYSEELYFKPYSKDDLKMLLKVDPAKPVSASTLNELIDLSGGHNQLFRILLSSQKQQNLLLDRFVKMQMKEFIDYLSYYQRKQLQKLALGKKVAEIDEYLSGAGLVKDSQIFTPLLSDYIKNHMPVKLPVKEAKLFKCLRKNAGNTVSKEEIFAEVWGENNENATDWALDALIYRLRKHPFTQANGYIIESQKKVGYTLIQT